MRADWATPYSARTLRSKRLAWRCVDFSLAACLNLVDLEFHIGDRFLRREHLQSDLNQVTSADRQGHNPVACFLVRPRVGKIRARLQTGHVAIA